MPEGDTIHRTARTLGRVLIGESITRFDTALPSLARIDADRPIAGRIVESVYARGKHLLIAFSGDLLLHTHMRMNGSWHVYPRGERWRRSARDMRVLLETARAVAVGFNIPIAEFLTRRDMARHTQLRALGPDVLAQTFDRDDVIHRIRAKPDTAVADALLDQRTLAGIGNVFKAEILFKSGIFPFRAVGDLSDADLDRVLDEAVRLLRANVAAKPGWPLRTTRQTTGSFQPGRNLWVYGRAGEPCRVCGSAIRVTKTGASARLTYWCPHCQPGPATTTR